jgi:hypothetical protein
MRFCFSLLILHIHCLRSYEFSLFFTALQFMFVPFPSALNEDLASKRYIIFARDTEHLAINTMISGFRRDVDKICGLLGYYAASCGNCLQTFRDNVSVPSWSVKIGPIRCPESSVSNYQTAPRNVAEEGRSHVHPMLTTLELQVPTLFQ